MRWWLLSLVSLTTSDSDLRRLHVSARDGQLQQWLAKHPGLKDKALADSVAKQPWDPSIQSMAAVPEVVKRLTTTSSGPRKLRDAFLAQQPETMEQSKRMRKKAKDKGALESNDKQKVETKVVEKDTIIIVQQTNPEVIYVPTYNPTYVYGPPVYPYPPVYYPPYTPGAAFVSFGFGMMMGAAIWGGSCCHYGGWGGGNNTVIINNNNNFNQFNHNRNGGAGNGNWNHNPSHRGGTPYGDKRRAASTAARPVHRTGPQAALVWRPVRRRHGPGRRQRGGQPGGGRRAVRAAPARRRAAGGAGASDRSAGGEAAAVARPLRDQCGKWRFKGLAEAAPGRSSSRGRPAGEVQGAAAADGGDERNDSHDSQQPPCSRCLLPRRPGASGSNRRLPPRPRPRQTPDSPPSGMTFRRCSDSREGAGPRRHRVPCRTEPDGCLCAQARTLTRVDKDSTQKSATLVVGADEFPVAIPIVEKNGQWHFDTEAGRQEVLNRRIGRNELDAIEVAEAYVEAPREYASARHDGAIVNQYAQRMISTPGAGRTGVAEDGTWRAPSVKIAQAIAGAASSRTDPLHGTTTRS
jgi:hypothetical protein